MPGGAPSPLRDASTTVCKRCAENDAKVVVRHEYICNECLTKYVESKIVKRMEGFRVRNSTAEKPRELLLAMSFGVSSLAVLHVLDQHLQRQQERTGRPGYKLHVFHATNGDDEAASLRLQHLQQSYPHHSFHPPGNVGENIATQNIDTWSEFDARTAASSQCFPVDRLSTSVKSPTSQADIFNILREKAVKRKAEALGCEGVLWGHSTTRLAESIMAETAKGRGFSLPWLANDGELPHGLLSLHPAKDLLRKELLLYWNILRTSTVDTFDPVGETKRVVSTKNTSIDQLMATYFGSVEDNYPSIVANVLRTSAKLSRVRLDEHSTTCKICEINIPHEDLSRLYNWGDDPSEVQGCTDGSICYGCARSILERRRAD